MEIAEIAVETVASATLPWDETILMAMGDFQYGAQGCDIDRIQRDVEWGMKHGAYFLGMGEYLDIASPSNRMKIKTAGFYDSTIDALEEIAQKKGEEFLALVKGSEDRWIGLLEGHHLYEFQDGTTSDTRIAQALRAPFLGTCAFIRLRFARNKHSRVTATIWAHHGAGGGQKAAAPLNKLENLMPYFDADIYLIGHQHKKVGAPIDQLYMTKKRPYDIRHRTKIIAGTGGYLKGYWKGSKVGGGFYPRGGYVERGMRNPVALGCVVLYIRPVHKGNIDSLDINISL